MRPDLPRRPPAGATPLRLIPWLLALAVYACGGGKPGEPAAKRGAAASAPSAALLLAAEDLHTVTAGTIASGPVISGSLQPERRADLRAEISAVVLQVLKDNGDPRRCRSRPTSASGSRCSTRASATRG